MKVHALLMGVETSFSYTDKKTGEMKSLQKVHVALEQDDPNQGSTVLSGMIDPSRYEAGSNPHKFPRPVSIDITIDPNRGASISSVRSS